MSLCYNGRLVPLVVIRLSICGTRSVAGYVNVIMPLIPSTNCHTPGGMEQFSKARIPQFVHIHDT